MAVLPGPLLLRSSGGEGEVVGSWSQGMRKSERRLSMNLVAADVSPLTYRPRAKLEPTHVGCYQVHGPSAFAIANAGFPSTPRLGRKAVEDYSSPRRWRANS